MLMFATGLPDLAVLSREPVRQKPEMRQPVPEPPEQARREVVEEVHRQRAACTNLMSVPADAHEAPGILRSSEFSLSTVRKQHEATHGAWRIISPGPAKTISGRV